MATSMTRRRFAGTLGVSAGAALLPAPFASSAGAAPRRPPRPEGAVLLNSNENPYGPSAKALEAASQAVRSGHRYPDAVEDEVRTAIAKHHGVPPECIVLGCGSAEILEMADMAFAGPSTRVVAAEPTFEAVLIYARVLRAEAVKVPLTADFRHDLPKMADACARGAGLVYVCNPNNPTGTIVTGDEMAAFAAKVPRATTILVDEAYHHFVEDPRYRTSCELIAKTPNLVVARTFSKVYGMAGLRLGYAVGPEAKIAEMSKYAAFSNANAAVCAAAAACLADPDLVPRQRKLLNDTRRWLVSELHKDGRRTMPSETNFLMVDVGGDVTPVIQAFRERKILVGRKFASLPSWLRVSIGTRDQMEAFHAALKDIVPASAATAA